MDKSTISVLHVDDNEDYLNLIKMRLPMEDPAFQIQKALSGNDALKLLQSNNIDCILADYEMPQMNGLQLLTEVRRSNLEIPFIFLTGQGNEEVAAEALRLGADDYFTKDDTIAYFPRIINSIKQNVSKYHHIILQKKSSRELAEREEQFRALISSLDDLIFILDKDHRFIHFYRTASRLPFKIPPEELIGKPISELIPEALCNKYISIAEKVFKTGQPTQIEFDVMIGKKRYWFLARFSKLYGVNGDCRGITAVITDISEMKYNEIKLQESEERYRFIVDKSFDVVFRIDLNTDKYDILSPSIKEHIGYTREEAMKIPRFMWTIMHPDDYERAEKHFEERAKYPEKEHTIVYRVRAKDEKDIQIEQRSRIILVEGKPGYILGVYRNIELK